MTTPNTNIAPKALYTLQRFLFMTLDPVHIGAGGYRLGRVDMTIAREPGTNLPKIPGTSLAGATRSYASMRYGKPDAAGQHNNVKKMQPNKTKCPIIYTFGTSTDSSSGQIQSNGTNQAGTVSIGDAHILFFPVNSLVGPVWVSTIEKVTEALGDASLLLPQNTQPTDDTVVTSLDWDKKLNLGWLMFDTIKGLTITAPDATKSGSAWRTITERLVLVAPKLFSQIVNSNLEVRTSVSINPETGAAEDGALFTYEAIPRTTWLYADIVEDDYRLNFPQTVQQCKVDKGQYTDNAGDPLGEMWSRSLDVVRAGTRLIEYLGIGGMGTRGFGRMRCVADWEVSNGGVQ